LINRKYDMLEKVGKITYKLAKDAIAVSKKSSGRERGVQGFSISGKNNKKKKKKN